MKIKIEECSGIWIANAIDANGNRVSVAADTKEKAESRCRAALARKAK